LNLQQTIEIGTHGSQIAAVAIGCRVTDTNGSFVIRPRRHNLVNDGGTARQDDAKSRAKTAIRKRSRCSSIPILKWVNPVDPPQGKSSRVERVSALPNCH